MACVGLCWISMGAGTVPAPVRRLSIHSRGPVAGSGAVISAVDGGCIIQIVAHACPALRGEVGAGRMTVQSCFDNPLRPAMSARMRGTVSCCEGLAQIDGAMARSIASA